MTPRNNLSRFSRCIWLTLGVFAIFTLLFVVYVHAEKQIDRANELRLQSHLLADELRQSSDDLTRMVRSYVVSGNPIYKQHFQEILDIRDGKRSRPVNYHYIYWDLVLSDDLRPRPDSGQMIPLLDLMRQAGFTNEEFAKLQQAKANSDALASTEFAAMRLIESTAPPTNANKLKASQMLRDDAYFLAKANIMQPISEFYQMMEQRTLNTVHIAETIAVCLRIAFVLFGLLLVFMLWRAYRALHLTLGSPLNVLHECISHLGRGEFSLAIPVALGMENSILGWLSATQINLARLDEQRKAVEAINQRMTQLYAALSQCNQAIVRCNNEDELFPQICRDAVIFGGMEMAWIGIVDDQTKQLLTVASYGSGVAYLDKIDISIDKNETIGSGPTGVAMREDRNVWCPDFMHDPITAPWHERGKEFGWGSSAAMPLHRNGVVIGVFSLYSSEIDAFDKATRDLLVEMVLDIDYALNNYEREAKRRDTESSLVASHSLLKTIIDTAPVRIFWKDKELRYLGCNTAFAADAREDDAQAIIGKNDEQLGWNEPSGPYRTDELQVIDSGVPKLFYEEIHTTLEGQKIWLRSSKVPLRKANNNEIIGVLGVYEDITKRKLAENLSRRHKVVIDASRDGFWVVNQEGIIQEANQAYADMSGYPIDELLSMHVSQLEAIDSFQEIQDRIAKINTYGYEHFETCHYRKDGSKLDIEVSINYLPETQQLFAFFRDISERKQAEDVLRESELFYRNILDASPDAMLISDEQGLITIANAQASQMLGYRNDELVGQSIELLIPERFHAGHEALRRGYIAAPSFRPMSVGRDVQALRKDGSELDVQISLSPVQTKRGLFIASALHDITLRKQAEVTLSKSLELTHAILNTAVDAIITIDSSGIVRSFNPASERLFDYLSQEVIGQNVNLLMPEPYHSEHDSYLTRYLDGGVPRIIGRGREVEGRKKDGSTFPMHLSIGTMTVAGERMFVGIVVDLTDHKRTEADLRVAATTFETYEAIMITDADAKIIRVNKAFEKITGYSADEVIGKEPRILKSGRHDQQFYAEMWQALLSTGVWVGEMWDRHKCGSIYPKQLTITAVKGAHNETLQYVAIFADISERKQAEEAIHHLAFNDPLTGLPNRRLLLDRLSAALSASERSKHYGALLFLDMDNFKALNDTFGHYYGDLLLVEVASRIKVCVREVDTVARLGGDEFVVLFENISEDKEETSQNIAQVAEKIREALSTTYQLKDCLHRSFASIGVCLFYGNNDSADELLKRADMAMYQAKDTGRNRVRFFDPQMQQAVEMRATLEADLRKAIADQQFQLYYQIQVDEDMQPFGAEALIRWIHPQHGMVSPAQFIPVAEESSLILEIGHWVLDTACQQLATWSHHEKMRDLILAVNVSAGQFKQPDFVEQVKAMIEMHSIDPSRLKLELTESIALENLGLVIAKMLALRDDLGVRLSLDDFGTGYSSLGYLKRLPLNQIKIDQSFVRDMSTDFSDAVMVKTIIDLAKNFDLDVIAEGVETESQLTLLKQYKCKSYQGYLFSKPVPLEEFEDLMKKSCWQISRYSA